MGFIVPLTPLTPPSLDIAPRDPLGPTEAETAPTRELIAPQPQSGLRSAKSKQVQCRVSDTTITSKDPGLSTKVAIGSTTVTEPAITFAHASTSLAARATAPAKQLRQDPAAEPAVAHPTNLDSLPTGFSSRNWSSSRTTALSVTTTSLVEQVVESTTVVIGGPGRSGNPGQSPIERPAPILPRLDSKAGLLPGFKANRSYLQHVKIAKKQPCLVDQVPPVIEPLLPRLPNKTLSVPRQIRKKRKDGGGTSCGRNKRKRSENPIATAQDAANLHEVVSVTKKQPILTKKQPTLEDLFDGDLSDVPDEIDDNGDRGLDISVESSSSSPIRPTFANHPQPTALGEDDDASRSSSPDIPLASVFNLIAHAHLKRVESTPHTLKMDASLTSMQASPGLSQSQPIEHTIGNASTSLGHDQAKTLVEITALHFANDARAMDTVEPSNTEVDVSVIARLRISTGQIEKTVSSSQKGIFGVALFDSRDQSSVVQVIKRPSSNQTTSQASSKRPRGFAGFAQAGGFAKFTFPFGPVDMIPGSSPPTPPVTPIPGHTGSPATMPLTEMPFSEMGTTTALIDSALRSDVLEDFDDSSSGGDFEIMDCRPSSWPTKRL